MQSLGDLIDSDQITTGQLIKILQNYISMQNLHLLEYSAEDFRCHVHHYQCLAVPIELAAMKFLFWFTVVGVAEMLVWQS